MTVKQRRDRISQIIRMLAEMSRDSWRHARPSDYQPLESELRRLQDEARG